MHVIGIDEVGRGALAGPLVVGAVKIPQDFVLPDFLVPLRDSKQCTKQKHREVHDYIVENLAYGVGFANVDEINTLGLIGSLKLAADRALRELFEDAIQIYADAGLYHNQEKVYPTERFIKGDTYIPQITLASHLAKYVRDIHMTDLAKECGVYGWEKNVGYGTAEHRKAILEHGKSIHHRDLFLRKLFQTYPK